MNDAQDPNGTTGIRLAPAEPLGPTHQVPGSASTVASRPGVPRTATERYTLGDEIARGGMGIVYRATDNTLGREVAVKVLLDKYGPESGVARRFADEARITSQLQHPSIPPVHDLGTLPDGRPFLAMKLIKGRTLEELLRDRSDPGTERGRFVAVFEQMCQALAYAHSHQVIHRDLKPANVMVGHFGEVQVMDWGLAKVLASGGRESPESDPEATTGATQVGSLRDADGSFTQAGSVLGTPAFMPPEQAVGAIGKVDARSDVFGLGAVLAVLLTGKPPFAAASAETTRVKAAQGDVAECLARLDACGAEPELVALCKRCLSPKPADRPSDAGAVAQAVAELRVAATERARRAELARVRVEGEKATAEAREAEQRKRRRVQLALAAAVVGLLLGGGAFAWWRHEQAQLVRQREGRNAEAVAALLDQSEEALRAGDAAKGAVALEAARKRSAEGGAEEQAERLGRLDADLALVRDLDAVDQFRWTWAENQFPDPAIVATRTRAALAQFGADPDAVSPDDAAGRVSASVVRERIVSALDRLLWVEKADGVRALLRRLDPDPYRDALRDAVLAVDQAKVVELADQRAALEQPPGFAAFLGEGPAIGIERRRQLLRAAVSRRPGDLGLLMTLGNSFAANQKEGADEQLRWYQAAVAAALANAAAHINLGVALRDKGQVDEAIACFQKAIELDPKNAAARNNLGAALHDKGRVDEAIACFQKAIELDPKNALAYSNLGVSLRGQGRVDQAIVCLKKAVELDPQNAAAHNSLGEQLSARGQVDEAIACFQKALKIDPKLATAHLSLGVALAGKGRVDEAIACFQKALEIDPKYAEAHCNLGHALAIRGRFAESLAAYKRGHELSTNQAGWPYPSAEWVREAEAKAALEAKLLALLKGEFQPTDNKERLALASVCQIKKLHHAAAGLYAAAFATDPKLANDLRAGRRYNAACLAALAAAGQGEDAAKLEDKERTRLRKQALDWLRADLALRTKQFESGKPADRAEVQQKMLHWQKDTDLAGIRDKAALAKLPSDEQQVFAQLWADVAGLFKKADEKAK